MILVTPHSPNRALLSSTKVNAVEASPINSKLFAKRIPLTIAANPSTHITRSATPNFTYASISNSATTNIATAAVPVSSKHFKMPHGSNKLFFLNK